MKAAADDGDSVGHVGQSYPVCRGGWVESAAVVGDCDGQVGAVVDGADCGCRGTTGVFGGVCRASRQQKYTAVSISGEYLPMRLMVALVVTEALAAAAGIA